MVPGALNVTLECPIFTQLQENIDTNTFCCEYDEWAYGLFAILLIFLILVPLTLLIYCLVKNYNRRAGYHRFETQQSETSHDSQFDGSHNTSYEVFSGHSRQKLSTYVAEVGAVNHAAPSSPSAVIPANQNEDLHKLRQMSASAPQLSSAISCVKRPTLQLACQRSLSDGQARALRADEVCSLCNDNSAMRGIFCQDCCRSPDTAKDAQFLHCGPQTCITHSQSATCPAPTAQQPKEGGPTQALPCAHLYPSLKDTIVTGTPTASMTGGNAGSVPTHGGQGSADWQRQQYLDYLLQLVEGVAVPHRNGFFTLRDSMSSNDCKVLMLYCSSEGTLDQSKVLLYKICSHREGGVSFEGATMAFPDIAALIEFYRSNDSQLPCRLTTMV